MMRAAFVYLSGPISPKNGRSVEANIATAVDMYLRCLAAGIPTFCPHLSAAFPSAHTAIPYRKWLAFDFAVIDRCTHLLMLDTWQESNGAIEEHGYAYSLGKPIFYTFEALQNDLRFRGVA